MERDISKIRKVLSSVNHDKQAVEVLQKSKIGELIVSIVRALAEDASAAPQEQMNLAIKTKRAMKILP